MKKSKDAQDKIPEATARSLRGRPEFRFDLKALEQLCRIHPTDEEIAAFFECSTSTVARHKKDPDFLAARERGEASARISLRRLMWARAEGAETEYVNGPDGEPLKDDRGRLAVKRPGYPPDPVMIIWLSKNLLGYSDRRENDASAQPLPPNIIVISEGAKQLTEKLIAGEPE